MSLLKANSVQIGQSATATNNFTLSVPSSPDGTIKLARGNSGATTQDILTVNSAGAVTLFNGGTITLGTVQNSTSGTAIDFTGIPSWAKRITVIFDGVSTNGTSLLCVRVGSGSFVTSGYDGGLANMAVGSTTVAGFTSSFLMDNTTNASGIRYGHAILTNISGNKWVISSYIARSDSGNAAIGAGSITLSGSLDRLRVTSVTPDTFDAGSINIMYEG